ncbi:hypothetical protein OS493_019253 [Desmophyllum pertusum]|uniref:Uncharacterized protein n=1 Tax=Desmophyllum pertusum TaxID=174260 RepID=A0A9X0CG24_9CNID|nr:hypothetical protein OS493_019253 [Desmophyllum pertusum]
MAQRSSVNVLEASRRETNEIDNDVPTEEFPREDDQLSFNSFAWILPVLIFCVTCMLLEKMFESLQNEVSNESFTIAYLRQEHLKLCEKVELANVTSTGVSAALLAVTFMFGIRVNEKKSRISAQDINENAELILFLAHLRGEPIGLSVGGLVVISKSLFLTLIGLIVSYFVVLVTLPSN